MSATDDATYVDSLEPGLTRRIEEMHAGEVAYFGSARGLETVRVTGLSLEVADDGVLDLLVALDHVRGGRVQHRETRRLRCDREFRDALDRSHDGSYVDWAAQCLYFGVGRPEEIDPAEVAAASDALPDAQALFDHMASFVRGTPLGPDRLQVGRTVVCLTPEQWRAHVVEWEVEARRDSGPDALRPGDGPVGAASELSDVLEDEPAYVVRWRGELCASSRAELPPI